MSTPTLHSVTAELVKAAPPLTVASISLAGITLNEWVLITTLIYTVLQIGVLVWTKIIKPTRSRK